MARASLALYRARASLDSAGREVSMIPDERKLVSAGRRRVLVQSVSPQIDGGRYDAKRCVGDKVTVSCDLVSDGHDVVVGALLVRRPGDSAWRRYPLTALGNDRFSATFTVDALGRWEFDIQGWTDSFATWRKGLEKKREVGQATEMDVASGVLLVRTAIDRAHGATRTALTDFAKQLADTTRPISDRIPEALDPTLVTFMDSAPDLRFATQLEGPCGIIVDPVKARTSAWYELFPRSTGAAGKHGTFRTVEEKLPYIQKLGFDVLYLPPIHPIGHAFRKGKNNSLNAEPTDVGSPWAIGAAEGGHKSVHPELGTLDDFRHLVGAAAAHGLQIALDIAFQASPDHPYVKEHPEWFVHRPDGSIQYAENPPKKYQDVYPFDFEGEGWRSLWDELLSVFLFWAEQGVTIFRVDNPHTKSLRFWEWCLGEVKKKHPEAIFLAEAFTRPKLMYTLAKCGFSQSYTYFTWRQTKRELEEYLTEIASAPVSDFYRPNFWVNTPDILPEHLQQRRRAIYVQRLVLAATLSSNYGMYGPAFELMESVPRAGTEEYVDNEKYQLRAWDLDDPDSIADVITRVNRIRRENPALAETTGIRFHPVDNDQLLCFSKRTKRGDLDDTILVVVNLDSQHTRSGFVTLDLSVLGVDPNASFQVHDLLSESRFQWQGPRNFVELNPEIMPAHIFRVRRKIRTENDFEYFL